MKRETRKNKLKNKNRYILRFTFILTLAILLNACDDSTGPIITNSSNPLKGAYILYYTPATGSDYAFYDAVKDSVTDFVFSSNNPGIKLGVNPGEMKLNSDRKFYVSTLGIPNSNGTIYKIDPESNHIIDSLRFGVNPYGFAINNNRIVISNSGSTNVTILDLDFNIIKDTIEVGPAPGYVLYGFNKYIVSRMPLNTESSIGLIDEISNNVIKLFFTGVPVSAIYNINGIFISTNNNKNIYRIDSESYTTIDSFAVPTIFPSISNLLFKTQQSFFAVAGGREVWLVSSETGTFTFTNIMQALSDVYIRSLAYEQNANELYLTSETISGGNTLIIIDGGNGSVKRVKAFAGNGSKSIVFRYF